MTFIATEAHPPILNSAQLEKKPLLK